MKKSKPELPTRVRCCSNCGHSNRPRNTISTDINAKCMLLMQWTRNDEVCPDHAYPDETPAEPSIIGFKRASDLVE